MFNSYYIFSNTVSTSYIYFCNVFQIFSNKSRTAPEEQLHDDKKIEEHIPKSSEVECQPIGLDENNSNHVVLSSASSMAANAPPPKESVANVLDAEDSDPAPVESDSEGVMMVSPAVRKARAPKSVIFLLVYLICVHFCYFVLSSIALYRIFFTVDITVET